MAVAVSRRSIGGWLGGRLCGWPADGLLRRRRLDGRGAAAGPLWEVPGKMLREPPRSWPRSGGSGRSPPTSPPVRSTPTSSSLLGRESSGPSPFTRFRWKTHHIAHPRTTENSRRGRGRSEGYYSHW